MAPNPNAANTYCFGSSDEELTKISFGIREFSDEQRKAFTAHVYDLASQWKPSNVVKHVLTLLDPQDPQKPSVRVTRRSLGGGNGGGGSSRNRNTMDQRHPKNFRGGGVPSKKRPIGNSIEPSTDFIGLLPATIRRHRVQFEYPMVTLVVITRPKIKRRDRPKFFYTKKDLNRFQKAANKSLFLVDKKLADYNKDLNVKDQISRETIPLVNLYDDEPGNFDRYLLERRIAGKSRS